MPQKKDRSRSRRIRASVLQPVLTYVAARNRRTRELASAMQLPCSACHATLAAHVGPANRWEGCPGASVKGGAR